MSRFRKFYSKRSDDNLFRLDGAVPLIKAVPFGIQHVLSMFVANIAPLLIIYSMVAKGDPSITSEVINNGIRSAVFFAALGTAVQLFPIWRIGSRLPIVVGLSFTFVGVLGLVGSTYGAGTMFVSIIIGGLVVGILGLFAKYWRRFLKPIVSACVVLGIGLSLLSVGVQDFFQISDSGLIANASGIMTYDYASNWPFLVISSSALISCIVFKVVTPGLWKNINILVGLVVGHIVALIFYFCGYPVIDFTPFTTIDYSAFSTYLNVPWPIFVFPGIEFKFDLGATLVVVLVYLVATTEGIGDLSSLANAGLGRDPTDEEIAGGLACDGFTSALSGCFGAMPLTTFSQNVGIVGQTKVVNRFTIFQGVIVLFLASLLPLASTFLMVIPDAVLGGCMIMLFASIIVIGMQMVAKIGFTEKNITIVSLAVGLGYGITLFPSLFNGDYSQAVDYLALIAQNPVSNMFIIALILSFVLPDSMSIDHRKRKNKSSVTPK